METRTKVLITVLVVGAVVGTYFVQSSNNGLFKGELLVQPAVKPATTVAPLPDLTADLVMIAPDTTNGDMSAKVTITNIGPGTIDGKKPFKYAVYLGNAEVFSNTDSYTTMAAGDSFSFTYPISRAVYNYGNSGKAKVVVDVNNTIAEANEANNSKEVDYNFGK